MKARKSIKPNAWYPGLSSRQSDTEATPVEHILWLGDMGGKQANRLGSLDYNFI
jgi:hypothetical protein